MLPPSNLVRAMLAAPLLLQGCSIVLDRSNVFTFRDRHVPAAQVQLEPDLDRMRVTEITVAADGRQFVGYRFVAPSPERAVLFFPGNGYGASAAPSRIAGVFGDNRTDVYALSYGEPEESVPSVVQVYPMAASTLPAISLPFWQTDWRISVLPVFLAGASTAYVFWRLTQLKARQVTPASRTLATPAAGD